MYISLKGTLPQSVNFIFCEGRIQRGKAELKCFYSTVQLSGHIWISLFLERSSANWRLSHSDQRQLFVASSSGLRPFQLADSVCCSRLSRSPLSWLSRSCFSLIKPSTRLWLIVSATVWTSGWVHVLWGPYKTKQLVYITQFTCFSHFIGFLLECVGIT